MLTPASPKYGSLVVIALLAFALSIQAVIAVEAVKFKVHQVGSQGIPIYQVRIVDMNGDGLPDILPTIASFEERRLSWFENPGWQRHVITKVAPPVGLWTAAQDLDGDGIPEIALAAGFTPFDVEKASGELFLLQHQGSTSALWQERLFDRLSMSHRVEFIDIDGSGDRLLVVSPVVGGSAESLEVYPGTTPLVYYTPDGQHQGSIKSDIVGYVHGMTAVDFDDLPGDEVLTAGLQGVWLHKPQRKEGSLQWTSELLVPGFKGPTEFDRGASDVRVGKLVDGRRFLLTVEPFHSGHAFVYLQNGTAWTRYQIADDLTYIHALAIGDLNGDGSDEIILGNREDVFETYVYYATDDTATSWRRHLLDDTMGGTDCNVADLNRDERLDIVCGGHYSKNLRWYENLGK
ncbi:MAG: VCBS repeat-containing protein [Gammaproteobacteria bacterium]|jgi:hypothetical protein|nr:VCBS repeat-containing protein [Gammaproteobacteria bacterium]